LENVGVDGTKTDHINLKITETGCGDVDWVQLGGDIVQWRALVNGYEPMGYTKDDKFLNYLNNYKLLKYLKASHYAKEIPQVRNKIWYRLRNMTSL
jgi:hypothetical protein